MKVIVLAAGYGTRLKSLGENTPKALLDINGRPILDCVLDKIFSLPGLSEVIIVTNSKFYETFLEWKKSRGDVGVPLTVLNDGSTSADDRLGSIGDIDFVLNHLKIKEDVLVVGSDNLFDYSLESFVEFAAKQDDSLTVGLYDIENYEDAKKFGVVTIDENKKMVDFQEKPTDPKSTLVSMCAYYMPEKSLGQINQYLIESQKSDKAGDYIQWLLQQRQVYGFQFQGKWYDIGSLESYHEAREAFKA